jgi:hypothetical protein
MKMTAFWDIAIVLMLEAVSTAESHSASMRLHGAVSQKAAIFMKAEHSLMAQAKSRERYF